MGNYAPRNEKIVTPLLSPPDQFKLNGKPVAVPKKKGNLDGKTNRR